MIFEPFDLGGLRLKNRLVRSSIGGRTSYYDGRVSPAWAHFERRFARTGVAALVSPTISVHESRWSPLEYPRLSDDRFVPFLARGIRAVQALGCRYLVQLGDPGAHTQTSLLPQREDGGSASWGFDLTFGYRSTAHALTTGEIAGVVERFAAAARRAQQAGADGLEITASKGYLIHQFLNPTTNRRRDAYGGSPANRFRLLAEVVTAVRREVGPGYPLGVRLSAQDYSYLPLNVRWPPSWPWLTFLRGNRLPQMLAYGRDLAALGVTYLHVSAGFGFLNPKESPGDWPADAFRLFGNATRHLSWKARLRAIAMNTLPRPLLRWTLGWGYRFRPAPNAPFAARFRAETGLPVIANGGFQRRSEIERALTSGQCDLVSMARPLLANPDLVRLFEQGREQPERPCTHCNACSVYTAVLPLGCYDPRRFDSPAAMEEQILAWSGGPDPDDPA